MTPDKLGKYEIRSTLGRGAMGVVYEGWDPVISRRVAIKTVRLPDPSDAEAQEELSRFKREAQAAGRLHHPNVVGVFDYNETADLAYIVMEFVEGQSLKGLVGDQQRMALPVVSRVLSDVLDGLAYCHERGVVHRDIKPANIMITPEGQAKIADFGIARIESSSMTQAGTVLGTPAFMSPEQFMGVIVDARTDIYSTGVLLFQLLTGERPFEGSMTTIMHKVLNTVPPKPSDLAITAPRSLDDVVARAMARRPEDRFPTAGAFKQAMLAALAAPAEPRPMPPAAAEDGTIIMSAPRPGAAARPAAAAPTAMPSADIASKAAAKTGGSKAPLFAGVAALIVIGGGAAAYVLTRQAPAPVVADAGGTADPTHGTSQTGPTTTNPASGGTAGTTSSAGGTSATGTTSPGTTSSSGTSSSASGTNTAPIGTGSSTAKPPATGTTATGTTATGTTTGGGTATAGSTQSSKPNLPPIQDVKPVSPTDIAQGRPPPPPIGSAGSTTQGTAVASNTPVQLIAPSSQLPPVIGTQQPGQTTGSTKPPPIQNTTAQSGSSVPSTSNEPVIVARSDTTPNVVTSNQPLQPDVAPQVNPPQVAVLTPAQMRPALAAALAGTLCSFTTGNLPSSGPAAVRGVASASALGDMRQTAEGATPGLTIDWNVLAIDQQFCPVLDVLHGLQPEFGNSLATTLALDGQKTRLVTDDYIIPHVTMPNYPAYLNVDYFVHDGTVIHLFPTEFDPAARDARRQFQPHSVVTMGTAQPQKGFPGWQIDQPYGIDLIVTITSSVPLIGIRTVDKATQSEASGPYLAALKTAIEAAHRRDAKISADALVLETAKKE
jgi:serine/threonine-protein kinase